MSPKMSPQEAARETARKDSFVHKLLSDIDRQQALLTAREQAAPRMWRVAQGLDTALEPLREELKLTCYLYWNGYTAVPVFSISIYRPQSLKDGPEARLLETIDEWAGDQVERSDSGWQHGSREIRWTSDLFIVRAEFVTAYEPAEGDRCYRVQVGVETIESPVWEVHCD
jgi:hypothetical protein